MKQIFKNYKFWLILTATVFAGLIVVWFVLRNRNPLDVNVSDIKLDVKLERFDKTLFNKRIPLAQRIQTLSEKYANFFEVFNYDIIAIGGPENRSYVTYLQTFLDDYAVRQAYHAADSVFSDTRWLDEKLTDGFKHYKYYYKNDEIPRVVAFVAGFNHSVVTMEGFVGVGLDKYLGAGCHLYPMMQIPEYACRQMTPERIPYDVMVALFQAKYPYDDTDENLLKRMIYEGKTLYFLDAMYPNDEDSLKHAYRKRDVQYCMQFERDMWTFMIDRKVLFSTDYLTIRNYCDDSPYTKDFGIESPPRAGCWIGYKIVKSYMEHNKATLTELMEENDYQKILNLSRYEP